MDNKEQDQLHISRHGNVPSMDRNEVYLVADLGLDDDGNTIQGRATDLLTKTMSLNINNTTDYVLAHELGHAIWGLIHPGCPCNSKTNGEFNIDDLNNFMHGESNKINNWNIRRYQFEKLYQN